MNWIAIASGASLGALLRYAIKLWVGGNYTLPWATLLANLLGCFLAGFLYFKLHKRVSPELLLFIFVGFLGSLTTFSTFGLETMQLFLSGKSSAAFLNIVMNLGFGLLGVWLGLSLSLKFKT